MLIDIFFADKRLSISDFDLGGGYTLPSTTPLKRELISPLLEHKEWIVARADNEAEALRLFEQFASDFRPVTAAGGVVMRDGGQTLFIHRNGRWDLPKGHWEEGETIEECALREVEEECGLGGLHIHHKLCETLHAYNMRGEWELKRSHWYAMRSDLDTTPLTPQIEEGIDRVEWLTSDQVEQALEGSFPTIRYVIQQLRG